jgi:PAS domain S-box-containing protein
MFDTGTASQLYRTPYTDPENIKVLLIEDNPGDARLVKEMLGTGGANKFKLEHVTRISQGLIRLRQENFQVILLDISLPDGFGLDTVDRVYHAAPHQPIIVLTGFADEILALRAVQEGAQDYLVKGQMDKNLLIRAIFYAMERKQAEKKIRDSEENAQRLAEENAIMARIGQIISSTLHIEEVYDRFAEEVQKLIPFDRIAITTVNFQENINTIAYCTGMELQGCGVGSVIPLNCSPTGEVVRKRSSLIIQIENREELASRFPTLLPAFDTGLRSMLMAPLFSKDQVIGVLHLRSCELNIYAERDLRLAEKVGNQISGAIANAELYAERMRAKEALRESEKRYRQVVENAVEIIYATDHKGNFTYANAATLKVVGYSLEEFKKFNYLDLILPEHRQRVQSNYKRQMQEKLATTYVEFPFFNKLGEVVWFGQNASLVIENDEVIGVHIIARNNTERIRIEERVHQSKIMLQRVFDGISDPLIMVDSGQKVRMLNVAAKDYFRTEFHEAIGKHCYQLLGRDIPCGDCNIAAGINKGMAIAFEKRNPFDHSRHEKIVMYPLKEADREKGGAIIRISDITETKLLQRQMIQNEKLASLGLLVSGIAHEINNPNNFITFNLPILRDYLQELMPIVDDYANIHPEYELFGMAYGEFREEIFRLLDNMNHGATRINTTVSKLRDFSRKKEKQELSWVYLKEVFRKAMSICEGDLKKKIKRFEMEVFPSLPMIHTDAAALEQVIINLLINAIQASDKEDSWIKLLAYLGEEGDVMIEVRDNGVGMDDKILGNLFDPFFTTKQPGTGTGLGLYVSQNLIEGLGGHIQVESEEGKGTLFRITLPKEETFSGQRNMEDGAARPF